MFLLAVLGRSGAPHSPHTQLEPFCLNPSIGWWKNQCLPVISRFISSVFGEFDLHLDNLHSAVIFSFTSYNISSGYIPGNEIAESKEIPVFVAFIMVPSALLRRLCQITFSSRVGDYFPHPSPHLLLLSLLLLLYIYNLCRMS